MSRRPRSRSLRRAFGEALQSRRHELGLSQERLGASADLHPTYISQLEHGKKSASLDSIERLAKALELTPSSLLALAEELQR